MKLTITQDPYNHAIKLGKKVHKKKQAENRKNIGYKNLQSDLYNFIMQSVLADYYHSAMPEFDARYKLNAEGKEFDIKKVSYDNLSQRTMARINKNQHESVKKHFDGYMFSSVNGNFKQALFLGYEILLPIPNDSDVVVYGCIAVDDVPKNSKKHTKIGKFGKEIDCFYSVNLYNLLPISKI